MPAAQVALLIYKYFPHGGGQRDAVALGERLQAAGVSVCMYVLEWEGPPHPSIEVHVVGDRFSGYVQNYQRYTAFGEFVRELKSEQRHQYLLSFVRIPHVDHYVAVDSCFRWRVVQKRPLWVARVNPRDRFFLDTEAQVLADSSIALSFLNRSQLAQYQQHFDVPESRVQILPPAVRGDCVAGADAAEVRRSKRLELGVAPTDVVVLSVGSGFRTKGVDRSLGAVHWCVERGVPVRYFVVGEDDERWLQKHLRLDLRDRVTALGGRDDVAALYQAADVLLHPARFEAGGKVLLEAMAAGLAQITNRRCGYAGIVEDAEAGVVHGTTFDQQVLNQSLHRLACDVMFRERLARNGLRVASTWGEDDTIVALAEDVLERLPTAQPH